MAITFPIVFCGSRIGRGAFIAVFDARAIQMNVGHGKKSKKSDVAFVDC